MDSFQHKIMVSPKCRVPFDPLNTIKNFTHERASDHEVGINYYLYWHLKHCIKGLSKINLYTLKAWTWWVHSTALWLADKTQTNTNYSNNSSRPWNYQKPSGAHLCVLKKELNYFLGRPEGGKKKGKMIGQASSQIRFLECW